MQTLTSIFLVCAGLAACLYLVGLISTMIHVRRRKRQVLLDTLPPLSLLKPVKGLEEDLEVCLRSLYEQDYPGEREVVFSSATRDDPALTVARKVSRTFPMSRRVSCFRMRAGVSIPRCRTCRAQ